ncbi:MAG: hypothetical protein KDJ75_04620 [Alphaproteobacteria bacterium]|nr:hypothetical protein [Alphaproteobacteria bacterium]
MTISYLPGLLTAASYCLSIILWVAALLIAILGRQSTRDNGTIKNIIVIASAFGLSFVIVPAFIFIVVPFTDYIFSLLGIDNLLSMIPKSIETGAAYTATLFVCLVPAFLMIHFRKKEAYKPRYSLRTVIIMLTLSFLMFLAPVALEACCEYIDQPIIPDNVIFTTHKPSHAP